ncbi:hypothetical protein J3A83DRAFT_4355650 [Scleroderma citrinum]
MPWHCTKIELIGYKTTHPIYLIWHNGLEVIKMIFSNPIFAKVMTYDPHAIFDLLSEGMTILPIMTTSNKIPVTSHTGNLEMHPLFLIVGNIQSDVWMKATSHAWSLAAFMPIPKFKVHSKYQTILQARVWHKCMDIMCSNLKVAACTGMYTPDPLRDLHCCFTPLVTYTANLPEQQMIVNVAHSSSPITLARLQEFNGKHTLHQLVEISQEVNPWDVNMFQKKCKECGLLGVHLPFWSNWMFSDPAIFLVPELLHTGHKFFFNHPLKWCKEVVRSRELNVYYKSMHKHVGVWHFSSDISHIQQMTGREHCNIQHTIISAIISAASDGFVRAIQSLINFIYLAQYPIHTNCSMNDLTEALQGFHAHKHFIMEAEAQRTKKTLQLQIQNVGSLMQYTADVSKQLLITHCKHTFECTSQNHNFTEQIIHLLDCDERMCMFNLYALMQSHNISLINPITDLEQSCTIPQPICNHFLKGIIHKDSQTTFNLTVKPDSLHHSIQHLSLVYKLCQLPLLYGLYVCQSALMLPNTTQSQFASWNSLPFQTWNRFQLQLISAFNGFTIMPSHLIQAYPPSEDFPLGCTDAILFSFSLAIVGQVCTVFWPQQQSGTKLPQFLSMPLMYDLNVDMWIVQQHMIDGPHGLLQRVGVIVPLVDTILTVELIPVYGQAIGHDMKQQTSQEIYSHFYLNSFADKEVYESLHAEM